MPLLEYKLHATCPVTKARAATMTLGPAERRNSVELPVFMPVGTQGTMKGLTTEQLHGLGCRIMLSNTYHLGLRPGPDLLTAAGGLHKFMDWGGALLTDSGGFQMVSLLSLAEIDEKGVNFRSPHDGTQMLLTPEKSIELQNAIGADIIMQLDDVVSSLTTGPRVGEAMRRSVRWLDRCVMANANPDNQNIFAIIQGGLAPALREECVAEMVKRNTPGYAIGGLSGGEEKAKFWRVVKQCCELLPDDKPRYLMGVGYAVDLVVCVALGVDMFDCVFPTRTARFGMALTKTGQLNLKSKECAGDPGPIDPDCPCPTCAHHSRARLHVLVAREPVACHLLTVHNITYQLELMRAARASILEGRFPEFVRGFMSDMHPDGKHPEWIVEALASVGIGL